MIAWLLIPAGILMIIYSDRVVHFTGDIPFAERWIGGGGTYTFIKLLGLAITLLSFMWIAGGLGDFLNATVGKLVPGLS